MALTGTQQIVAGLSAMVIILFFLAYFGLLFYLHYRNKHPTPPRSEPRFDKKWQKFLVFFFKDLLVELIGMVFFVFTVIEFRTYTWNGIDMKPLEVAFYVIQGIKFFFLFFFIYLEHFHEELDDKITLRLARLGIRSDWKGILESLIFIPSLIVDGMLTNCEFVIGDNGSIFNGDGVIMIVVDVLLWIKTCVRLLLHQYSNKGHAPYQVKEFGYALSLLFFNLILVLMYILEHLNTVAITGIKVTSPMAILLTAALTHSYVCGYSSMMCQCILMFDKALRGSQARIKQLKLFIRYMRLGILPILFTLGFNVYTLWLYIICWTYSIQGSIRVRPEVEIQGMIYAVYIIADIFLTFFTANLGYELVKRFGGYFNIQISFCGHHFPDCRTYAHEINKILGQCTANFRIDNRGQVSLTR